MKPTLVILAFASLAALAMAFTRIVPARASANPPTEPVSTGSCVDRYNSLLKNAKAALTAGDRAATVDLLEQAKHMVPACPALQDGTPQLTVLISRKTCDGGPVKTVNRTCLRRPIGTTANLRGGCYQDTRRPITRAGGNRRLRAIHLWVRG
jgi:hypothetical protein